MEGVMSIQTANQDIRKLLDRVRQKGVYKYAVAYAMGVSEVTLSRHLRREMSAETKKKIKNAVKELLKS